MEHSSQDVRNVSGYYFVGEDDAALASQEEKKVAYLEKHVDYHMPDKVLQIYQKAIEERIFKTPVGYDYLKKLQRYLYSCEGIDKQAIPPIKLYVNFLPRTGRAFQPARSRIKPPEEKKKLKPLPVSIFFNILLALAVALMFYITTKSDNPNILNYETAIQNKYSSWEQELSEREQAIREKEKELNISISQ